MRTAVARARRGQQGRDPDQPITHAGLDEKSVRSATIGVWLAFANAQAAVLPQAQVVHDRFHVAGYLNEAVDNTRKEERRQLSRRQDTTLSRTKYRWLRSEATLSEKQTQSLPALSGLELETAQVWAFKECFRQLFDCQTEHGARVFFRQWFEAVV